MELQALINKASEGPLTPEESTFLFNELGNQLNILKESDPDKYKELLARITAGANEIAERLEKLS